MCATAAAAAAGAMRLYTAVPNTVIRLEAASFITVTVCTRCISVHNHT